MLLCPVRNCHLPLAREGSRLVCSQSHSFDVARSGYINLLQPQDRRSPAAGDRDEAVICYKEFVGAMLDVTDNIVGGEIVPPDDVVRHDADDAYLVGAADKGPATCSDLANESARRACVRDRVG